MSDNEFLYYTGEGTTLVERRKRLPGYEEFVLPDRPEDYIAEPGLRDAVNVAVMLGQPLLVTGDPGTGKTQLAQSVAHELGLGRPLVFNTKTTSTARDLFYRYDSLAHFRDAQLPRNARDDGAAPAAEGASPAAEGAAPAAGGAAPVARKLDVEDYITYEALGLAILLARPAPAAGERDLVPEEYAGLPRPRRSVVLIDEIDKAPRDLPNDVLNEIETMSFTVRETGRAFSAPPEYRPVVILTSNAEKNLPEPLLRRCVFYHIKFPDRPRLERIVNKRLGPEHGLSPEALGRALDHFFEIRRNERLRRQPATAELLSWLRVLAKRRIDPGDPASAERLAATYPILLKYKEDLDLLSPPRRQDPA